MAYLVFNFIDRSGDSCKKLFPSYTQCLHCVLCVSVLEYHGFLHILVVTLQLINIGLERRHFLLNSTQFVEMIFQWALLYSHWGNSIKVSLDPLSDHVGLGGKLSAQALVVLLTDHLCLQYCVSVRYQLTHFLPLVSNVLQKTTSINISMGINRNREQVSTPCMLLLIIIHYVTVNRLSC